MDLSASVRPSVRPFSSASWGDRLYLWDLADCKHGLQIEVMLCLSAMTVSVVNYDNFSDCFEYRIITIIIITKGMRFCFLGSRCRCHLSTTVVAAGLAVVGLNCCCSSGHGLALLFYCTESPSRSLEAGGGGAVAAVRRCAQAKAYDRASAWELYSRARNSLCIFNFLCLCSLRSRRGRRRRR